MAALSVEHLKVMAALTVEPAYAFNLLIGWGGLDGGLISRAMLRMMALVEPRILSWLARRLTNFMRNIYKILGDFIRMRKQARP